MNNTDIGFKKTAQKQLFKTALFAVFLPIFLSSCSKVDSSTNTDNKYVHTAKIMTIKPSDRYVLAQQYVGKISAKQFANVSFEYSGTINEVLVDSGEHVEKGQLLAQQNTELLTINLAQLNAQISQTNAQIALNKANLTRLKSLIGQGYTSEQNIDELTAEQQILHAKLQELDATLRTVEYQITKAALIAPYQAVIGKRLISKGEFINGGSPTFRLIAQDNNEITLGVPSKLAATLTLNESFPIIIGTRQSTAKLIAIGQQVDPISRTVKLRLTLQDKMNTLNGQLVRVTIKQQIEKTGFWIPLNAITDGIRGQWNIFVANKNADGQYKLQAETVKVIHATKDLVFITGLSKREHQIIADGLHRLVPGQIVKAQQIDIALEAKTL